MSNRINIAISIALFVMTFVGTIVFLYQAKLKNRIASGELVFEPATVSNIGAEPITNISIRKAADVADDDPELAPNALVLGVTVNGESRAYPLNQLIGPSREIFNDHLGGRAIMPTW